VLILKIHVVRVNRLPATVVGVMSAGFAYPSAETEMWMPYAMAAAERGRDGSHYLSAVARMKPGVTLEQGRANLAMAAARLVQSRPDGNTISWEVLAFPLHEYMVRDVRRPLVVR
jgi:hypothetical protein